MGIRALAIIIAASVLLSGCGGGGGSSGGGDMFGGAISTAIGPNSGRLVTADFNGDGKVDIGVPHVEPTTATNDLAIFLSNGDDDRVPEQNRTPAVTFAISPSVAA